MPELWTGRGPNGELFLNFDVINHGMAKSFRRCPRQFRYKYVQQIQPRIYNKPLTRGTWFHELLEAHYSGKDWKKVHRLKCREFSELFDEEKEKLGDLPTEMLALMRSYLWHYAHESEWEVLAVEMTIECELPDGRKFRGRVDMLVRDDWGLWLVDHKTHTRLPNLTARQLDVQSPLYVWACWQNDIQVDGFTWNYVKTLAPATPTLLKNGSRFSKKLGETDYYTFAKALKQSGLPVEDYRDKLNELKAHRFEHNQVQTSPFFQRHTLERTDESIEQALREFLVTRDRIATYDFDPKWTERHNDRSCEWMCDYSDICIAELHGNNTKPLMRDFKSADPFEYYGDKISVTREEV